MNKTIITNSYIGNKGKVELRFTPGAGKAVASYSLSVPKDFNKGDKKEYDFFNCVTWGNNAEWLANNAHRIKKINVIGRLQSRSYEAADGTKRYVVEIVTDNIEVAEWNNEEVTPTNTSTGVTEVENDDMDCIPF